MASERSDHPRRPNALPLAGLRIGFFVEDEQAFLFPAVHETIKGLRTRGAEVVGLGVFPSRLASHRGTAVPLWYLRTFGIVPTALLAGYTVLSWLGRFYDQMRGRGLPPSWQELGGRWELEVGRFSSPNHKKARSFLEALDCDVLFIMVPYVLSSEVLRIPKIGVINKHAALLPGCRGLMPFVWSVIHGRKLGVTFHAVVEEIDAGAVLVQEGMGEGVADVTMLGFYRWVFARFPDMACRAVEVLLRSQPAHPVDDPGDYFSLPARSDYLKFRRAGGRVARLSDLWS